MRKVYLNIILSMLIFVLSSCISGTRPASQEQQLRATISALETQVALGKRVQPTLTVPSNPSETVAMTRQAEPTRPPEPTNTPKPTPVPSPTLVKCKWAIQAYNASDPRDLNQIIVNGLPLLTLPDKNGFLQDTEWIDISGYLVEGDNVVRFAVYSRDKTATWGFRIRRGNEVVVDVKGASTTGGGGVFDESYILTADCAYRKLQPTGDEWIVEGDYDNWAGALILLDGVPIREFGGQTPGGSYSFDISKWILSGQSHQLGINGRDFAPMNGSTHFVLRVRKNRQIIFSRDFYERDQEFQSFAVYILPDGRLSLTQP